MKINVLASNTTNTKLNSADYKAFKNNETGILVVKGGDGNNIVFSPSRNLPYNGNFTWMRIFNDTEYDSKKYTFYRNDEELLITITI